MEEGSRKKRRMKFYTDINIEEPFLHSMAFELNGTRIRNRNGTNGTNQINIRVKSTF